MMRISLPLLLPLLLGALAAPQAASADPLDAIWAKIQPARAVYILRQAGERSPDAPVIAGRMVLEAKLTCSEISTQMTMEIRATVGAQTMTAGVEQQATESRDGRIYRFSARTTENGRVAESREGQAVLQSREGPGEAKIRAAVNEEIKLERGTVLPGTHLLRLLLAAEEGKTALESRVFYGLDSMRIVQVKSTIAGKGRSEKAQGLGEFADKPGWTVREEQRDISGRPGAVTQNVEMFVTEDAVTTRLALAIQNLELVATPLSIEKLPKPPCPN